MSTDTPDSAPSSSEQAVLTETEIAAAMEGLAGWSLSEGSLTFTAVCDTPAAALDLVAAIGQTAQAQNHHPDLLWSYDEVTLDLRSHDVDGITARDLRLARAVSALTGEFGATPLGFE